MNWWSRFRRLRALGILGMNQRNTSCILDLNPRNRFPIVDGKRQMQDLCLTIDVPTPEIFAVIAAHSSLRHLPRLLAGRRDFVIKPNRGTAGRGVVVIVDKEPRSQAQPGSEAGASPAGLGNDVWRRHNGERLELSDLAQHVSDIISGLFSLGGVDDEALIQQRVVSDPVLDGISFQGVADVRVIVYKMKPVMAMLRLPTRLSGGRANLHQGAIGVGVNLKSGITQRAVLCNRVTCCHPDTGASVVGIQVPQWPKILDMAQKVSQAVAMGYLGVDIVLDRTQGPLLMEANARPGLAIQIANGAGLLPHFDEIDRRIVGPVGNRPPR